MLMLKWINFDMAKIFVSRELPEDALAEIKNVHEIVVSAQNRPLTMVELVEGIKGMDGILSLLNDKIDGEVMDAAGPQLKVISNYAVGFDNIKIEDATSRGIVVTNTPCDEVNEAVAEHAWALTLSLMRRVVEADEVTREGAYKGWEPDIFLGSSLKGKVLGIVGMGRIGEMMAARAAGFDMKILYFKRSRDEEAEKRVGAEFRGELSDLLKESDIVSLHVPLTDETRHMMNKETLGQMKKGSYLINTARGPVVNEHDLAQALRDGKLEGAALDVFDNEPNIHPELIGMENVILTPHIASATHEARAAMGKLAVEALMAVMDGRMPNNIVNKEVWENRRV
jgi:glyoxylate reductase